MNTNAYQYTNITAKIDSAPIALRPTLAGIIAWDTGLWDLTEKYGPAPGTHDEDQIRKHLIEMGYSPHRAKKRAKIPKDVHGPRTSPKYIPGGMNQKILKRAKAQKAIQCSKREVDAACERFWSVRGIDPDMILY